MLITTFVRDKVARQEEEDRQKEQFELNPKPRLTRRSSSVVTLSEAEALGQYLNRNRFSAALREPLNTKKLFTETGVLNHLQGIETTKCFELKYREPRRSVVVENDEVLAKTEAKSRRQSVGLEENTILQPDGRVRYLNAHGHLRRTSNTKSMQNLGTTAQLTPLSAEQKTTIKKLLDPEPSPKNTNTKQKNKKMHKKKKGSITSPLLSPLQETALVEDDSGDRKVVRKVPPGMGDEPNRLTAKSVHDLHVLGRALLHFFLGIPDFPLHMPRAALFPPSLILPPSEADPRTRLLRAFEAQHKGLARLPVPRLPDGTPNPPPPTKPLFDKNSKHARRSSQEIRDMEEAQEKKRLWEAKLLPDPSDVLLSPPLTDPVKPPLFDPHFPSACLPALSPFCTLTEIAPLLLCIQRPRYYDIARALEMYSATCCWQVGGGIVRSVFLLVCRDFRLIGNLPPLWRKARARAKVAKKRMRLLQAQAASAKEKEKNRGDRSSRGTDRDRDTEAQESVAGSEASVRSKRSARKTTPDRETEKGDADTQSVRSSRSPSRSPTRSPSRKKVGVSPQNSGSSPKAAKEGGEEGGNEEEEEGEEEELDANEKGGEQEDDLTKPLEASGDEKLGAPLVAAARLFDRYATPLMRFQRRGQNVGDSVWQGGLRALSPPQALFCLDRLLAFALLRRNPGKPLSTLADQATKWNTWLGSHWRRGLPSSAFPSLLEDDCRSSTVTSGTRARSQSAAASSISPSMVPPSVSALPNGPTDVSVSAQLPLSRFPAGISPQPGSAASQGGSVSLRLDLLERPSPFVRSVKRRQELRMLTKQAPPGSPQRDPVSPSAKSAKDRRKEAALRLRCEVILLMIRGCRAFREVASKYSVPYRFGVSADDEEDEAADPDCLPMSEAPGPVGAGAGQTARSIMRI
uniref:Uncharacterized protein n=1 Tax=Chromera velia CCMP2878 TaxID=1169474 RepID=A0A0G4HMF6_9ALVE|eukprot:Cvel_29071.t1-p1 / transcript=Cvel_29071.t1 / gene=Cvel_29071 / organism=Chromera_velia_CCMP2878 / gene_product=hypothetical protein / transcript_product=hypothetical protein / location=Cvel_scaffold3921:5550-9439(-) / protein_length=913 / sequence_SO=supercontig / SO=protein_coding / is_pseudo=false